MFGSSIVQVSATTPAEAARKAAADMQAEPVLVGLAAHVRKRWVLMRDHKRKEVEPRLLACQMARNMQYPADKLAGIREQGGSEIYMGLISTKCRTATAWLRDALLGSGDDKPWGIEATPLPDVPQDILTELKTLMQTTLQQYYAEGGEPLAPQEAKKLADGMRDTALRQMRYLAGQRVRRMEKKIEDQFAEGGFSKAMFELTNDVVTFPYAVLKGAVPRKRKTLAWENGALVPTEVIRDEWERVDPFKFYWAPWGDDVQSTPCIEVHDLTRDDISALIGVEGYNEDMLRAVLDNFGAGGSTWLDRDPEIVSSMGKDFTEASSDIIAALQLWDSIPGTLLLEWGLSEEDIPDPALSYPCEVWLIDNKVVKAVLNYDPLGRKPYQVTSFEKVPGRLDGNGVADLCMDAQEMCNAAARALANNVAISSGPQVGVNISRLPSGENITKMFPWKIWQFRQSDYNDQSPPLSFFQPNSNARELMMVFDRFMELADEVSGIPKYMTGQHVPGAGRTSSGLSMLISNAGKSIKQVIANIDQDVLTPMLERQYQRNLIYFPDEALAGDVHVVARGAMALVVKEAEAVRKMDFLRVVLESPVAQQIVGLPGAAELLRDLAGNLNMNIDRLVPTRDQIEQKVAQQEQMAQMQAQMAQEQMRAETMQEDGSAQGGRESNFVSSRPAGK